MCVSPFLPWIGGDYSTNAFASLGPLVNPETALPEWLGAIPLAFGFGALAVAAIWHRDRHRLRLACLVLAGVTVLVPGYWTIGSYEGYSNPSAVGPDGIGVYMALAGEALIVLAGVISLLRERATSSV